MLDYRPWTLSVPRSSEFLLGTDCEGGQIPEHIFALNGGCCLDTFFLFGNYGNRGRYDMAK